MDIKKPVGQSDNLVESEEQIARRALEELLDCCQRNPVRVEVLPMAKKSARQDFLLHTADDLKAFLCRDAISDWIFQGRTDFRKSDQFGYEKPAMINSFVFISYQTRGYLAFFQVANSDRWAIKSMKLSDDLDYAKKGGK